MRFDADWWLLGCCLVAAWGYLVAVWRLFGGCLVAVRLRCGCRQDAVTNDVRMLLGCCLNAAS
eukprot:5937131-Lingulodinium_polyedra.AAC.1